jgi:hypothetical protein
MVVLFAPPTVWYLWIPRSDAGNLLIDKITEINLIVQLLVFSMIRIPAVNDGCRNSIHRRRRAPKQNE